MRYFNERVKPARIFRLPDPREREAMADLARRFAAYNGDPEGEALQAIVYAVGKEHEFEPLRDWFKALYEVLLGAPDGPRFGAFAALYGVPETIELIDRALAGELADA